MARPLQNMEGACKMDCEDTLAMEDVRRCSQVHAQGVHSKEDGGKAKGGGNGPYCVLHC